MDYLQALRLVGVSFESADNETLNNWHERLNVTRRNIASPNVALWSHIVPRRERSVAGASRGEGFTDRPACAPFDNRVRGPALKEFQSILELKMWQVVGCTTAASWCSYATPWRSICP